MNRIIQICGGADAMEFLAVYIIIAVLFLLSLKRKEVGHMPRLRFTDLGFGKEMNTLLKGIACIMILMSHYVALSYGHTRTHGIVYYTAIYPANVALVWFMYSSGYGLSLNPIRGGQYLNVAAQRMIKVYMPLVFVCFLSMILKTLISVDGTLSFPYLLGMKDEWYVWCIIYFYGIYYFAQYLSDRIRVDMTIILAVSLIGYFVFAYHFFGEAQAHYYRFPLAFMAGHLVGKKEKKWVTTVVICIFMMTFFFVEFHFLKCYILAFAFILILSVLDKYYEVSEGGLFKLGLVSYFFYLCHQRISEPILKSLGIQDCLLWIAATFLVAYLSNALYNKYILKTVFR